MKKKEETNLLANIGRGHALIMFIFGIVSFLALFVAGIYYLATTSKWGTVDATVVTDVCVSGVSGYICSVTVLFVVNKTAYGPVTVTNFHSDKELVPSDKIKISYLKSDPNIVQPWDGGIPNWELGLILMLVGIFILLMSGGFYYLTEKYKAVAEFSGAWTIGEIFSNIFKF